MHAKRALYWHKVLKRNACQEALSFTSLFKMLCKDFRVLLAHLRHFTSLKKTASVTTQREALTDPTRNQERERGLRNILVQTPYIFLFNQVVLTDLLRRTKGDQFLPTNR